MSKELDEALSKMQSEHEKNGEFEHRKKIWSEKDLTLKEHRTALDLNALIQNTNELQQAKTVDLSKLSSEEISQLVIEMEEYLIAAKNSMKFINKSFDGVIPFFRKNLIVVLADTGHGKSTAVANIAFNVITSKNPVTGKSGKILVLSNEEKSEDFYGRVCALIKGWNYNKHDQFTDEQRKAFSEYIPLLAKDGRLTVIGDTYQGVPGWTRTIEGIETIFNNLIRDKIWYDAVLIDYYQNVASSKVDPRLDIYKCQEKIANILEKFKNSYPAPIVIMGQINKLKDEDDTTPYNVRIKGRKALCDAATVVCELTPVYGQHCSKWTIHKGRFSGTTGEVVTTGFDRGKFVPYSIEFQKNVATMVNKNLERQEAQKLGIVEVETKGDKNDP